MHWFEHYLMRWEKDQRLGLIGLSLWVLVLSGLAFFVYLGSIGLIDETEPLFAEAARQMLEREDWITPYVNAIPRFDKPPLIYWLMALNYQLFGFNAWSVRLPSAMAAIALVGFLAYVLYRYGQPSLGRTDAAAPPWSRWLTAIIGVACLALNLGMIAWGRTGVSDMLLNAGIGGSLLCFFLGYATTSSATRARPLAESEDTSTPATEHAAGPAADRRRHTGWRSLILGWPCNRWYWAFYVLIALAILAKGPVGIVLPGLTVISFLMLVGQFWTVVREAKPVVGLSLIALLTLPWYLLIIQANGEGYIRSFFGYHNVERFTRVVNSHGAPWYFYFLVLLLTFVPWSVYLPLAIGRLRFWQLGRWRQAARNQQLGIYALCWLVSIFAFFTIAATKLPSYILPLMPAAAILVALYWSATTATVWQHGRPPQHFWWASWLNALMLFALAAAFFIGTFWLGQIYDPAMPNLPEDIERSGLLWVAAGLWGSLAVIAIGLLLWRQGHWLWVVNTLSLVLFLILILFPASMTVDTHRQQPLRELATLVKNEANPQEPFILLAYEKPSVIFYSERLVIFFRRAIEALYYMQHAQQQEPYPSSFLVLLDQPKLADLESLGFSEASYEILQEADPYALLRFQAAAVNKQPIDCEALPAPRRPFWEKGIIADLYPTPALQMLEDSRCEVLLDYMDEN
ncbi:MAG: glycosyltransferase family 39 protein [Cyanobacteria bacterium P01_H01_bin.121]